MFRYVLEQKKTDRTKYSQDHLYIRITDNYKKIVVNIKEATKFQKGSLKKWYKIYGRENIILHKIKQEE